MLSRRTDAPTTPPSPGYFEYAERRPLSSPASAGLILSRTGEAPRSGRALHRRKKLAARPGAWAETRACALNRSPKPSLANSLAFEADARVVSPKAVNGGLRASVQFAALQAGRHQSRIRLGCTVMPGVVPGIHVFFIARPKTWMAGTSPAMTQVEQACAHSGLMPCASTNLLQFAISVPSFAFSTLPGA